MTKSMLLIIRFAKTLIFSCYRPKSLHKIIKNVPYFSQWESPELVDNILSKKVDARQDPQWPHSGAANQLEYLHWSWSTCGLACLRMVIKYSLSQDIPSVSLAKQCLDAGVYSLDSAAYQREDYVHSISDLKYKPFVNFINHTFPLQAKTINPLVTNEILYYLDKHYFIMASVNSKIRDPQSTSTKKGGHLILILGYDIAREVLIFHNPSGFFGKTQEYTEVSFSQFNNFFGHQGIIIKHL